MASTSFKTGVYVKRKIEQGGITKRFSVIDLKKSKEYMRDL
jgi:hypothetical protein